MQEPIHLGILIGEKALKGAIRKRHPENYFKAYHVLASILGMHVTFYTIEDLKLKKDEMIKGVRFERGELAMDIVSHPRVSLNLTRAITSADVRALRGSKQQGYRYVNESNAYKWIQVKRMIETEPSLRQYLISDFLVSPAAILDELSRHPWVYLRPQLFRMSKRLIRIGMVDHDHVMVKNCFRQQSRLYTVQEFKRFAPAFSGRNVGLKRVQVVTFKEKPVHVQLFMHKAYGEKWKQLGFASNIEAPGQGIVPVPLDQVLKAESVARVIGSIYTLGTLIVECVGHYLPGLAGMIMEFWVGEDDSPYFIDYLPLLPHSWYKNEEYKETLNKWIFTSLQHGKYLLESR